MPFQRNKEVRAVILKYLYDRFQNDPHAMFDADDVLSFCEVTRDELKRNIFYMEETGWIECMKSYESTLFAAVRIAPGGVDLVEDSEAFEKKFGLRAIDTDKIDAEMAEALWRLRELALCNFDNPDVARDQLRLLETLLRKDGSPDSRIKAIIEWLGEDYADLEAASVHVARLTKDVFVEKDTAK
ncbi:hypothetical protein ACFL1X_04685 [Candidatus Hydrogenedentota bacterium]